MATLSSIKNDARSAAAQADNNALKLLARAVENLAKYVDDVENKADSAASAAAEAKRDARR